MITLEQRDDSDLVIPIKYALREAENKAIQLDWEGKDASFWYRKAERLRERISNGEEYEVKF